MKQPEIIKIRFEKYITKQNKGDCWLWNGADKQGYGKFWNGFKYMSAHRAAWEIYIGEIPKNQLILHSCDNPQCVNPHHLFCGTQSDNICDCIRKGRYNYITRARGEANGRARLKAEDVIQIRNSNDKIEEMSKKYNVNWMTIKAILTYKSWKHI